MLMKVTEFVNLFLAVCDKINQFYSAKMEQEDWHWRTPFKTAAVEISRVFSKEELFSILLTILL